MTAAATCEARLWSRQMAAPAVAHIWGDSRRSRVRELSAAPHPGRDFWPQALRSGDSVTIYCRGFNGPPARRSAGASHDAVQAGRCRGEAWDLNAGGGARVVDLIDERSVPEITLSQDALNMVAGREGASLGMRVITVYRRMHGDAYRFIDNFRRGVGAK